MTILIAGCPCGAGNIGDDAILEGMLRTIRIISPDIIIKVSSWNPVLTQEMFKNYDITAIYAQSNKRILYEMFFSGAVIVGGGTLVDDSYDGLAFPINHTVKFLKMAKWLRKKVFIYAIGANALHSQRARNLVRKYYAKTAIITTRDDQSKQVMKGLGINDVSVLRDPAFTIDPLDEASAKKILRLRGIEKSEGSPLIGVSVMNEKMKKVFRYKVEIAKACDFLIEKYKAQIVFVAHECRPSMDIAAIRETIEHMKNEPLILSKENYHPREMAGMIKCFDLTIGMRMHFLILSAVAHVPFIAISRIDKVNNFMRLFGVAPVGHIDEVQSQDIIAEAERILQDKSAYKTRIKEGLDKILKESEGSTNLLKGFLSSKK
ncbi:MAG: polysaccharide pyruvyl transferase family protein [Candidatus Omnitrophica bacterium]|nr:polysaccharide pyruvyl transferase family protein [Candidatus Omnitrophota bacterium]